MQDLLKMLVLLVGGMFGGGMMYSMTPTPSVVCSCPSGPLSRGGSISKASAAAKLRARSIPVELPPSEPDEPEFEVPVRPKRSRAPPESAVGGPVDSLADSLADSPADSAVPAEPPQAEESSPDANPSPPPQSPASFELLAAPANSQQTCDIDAATNQQTAAFLAAARKVITDKVDSHHYDVGYGMFLGRLRSTGRPLKLLEIGLGCNMKYGAGHSAKMWHDYLPPGSQIHIFEYDRACAEKVPQEGFTIHVGDQANTADLQKVIDLAGSNFDAILDDGGHTMRQQKVSMNFLIPHVRPGGYYFIEDLISSYMIKYNPRKEQSAMSVIKDVIDAMHRRVWGEKLKHQISRYISDVWCQEQMCVLHRNLTP